MRINLLCGLSLIFTLNSLADTLVFSKGDPITGTVIQTNGEDLLFLTDHGTFNFGRSNIKEIKFDRNADASQTRSTNRLPDFKTAVLSLSGQTWSSSLTPIPATVIDKGILRNVPYVSFRCNEDYELNIYGDLEDPAGIELGVYRKLLNDETAKANCLKFISDLLGDSGDREVLRALSLQQDLKQRNGLSFEITPPTAEDAYEGWWVSVFSEAKLNRSRASEKELKKISVAKVDALRNGTKAEDDSGWTAEQVKLARPALPQTITFVNSSGEVVTNAEVVRVVDGAYVIWRKGPTTGRVKLADLSEELRERLGYDLTKAAAAYLADERRAQSQVIAIDQPQQSQQPSQSTYSGSASSSDSGRVFVHGYTRRDGSYVQAHTRSYPRR